MAGRVKSLILDIDGTVTIDRSTYWLSLEAIMALRRAVASGISVIFVSSNALPIVIGLSRYIGLNGPVIAESGCLVYHDSWDIVKLTEKSSFEVYRALLEKFSEYVDDSWQNKFRLCEYALKLRREYTGRAREVLEKLREFTRSEFPGFTVDYSGYALHIRSIDVDKGRAVLYVLERLGIDPSEAAGVGDSYMDLSFLRYLGYSAAVSNADEELKKGVKIVLSKPSGLGVAEFIDMILSGVL